MSSFSIVLSSDTYDRFHESVVFAAGARAQGKNVIFFLRGLALKAYVENRWAPASPPRLQESLLQHQSLPPQDLLTELRAKGKFSLYACSAWVQILGLDSAKVTKTVDAIVGINAFLSQGEGGPILYI